ncbi:MAG: 3-hydroxyacyl-CoA dehydrogenase family protein [Deltaproteobacteria bacterium]|nr:3-hydroxyacyl-CoA dehydrogenase family protein [Deltaproteobacteria bacterium]
MADVRASRQLAESRPIKKVVVLGANGTMGYQSGALFAAAGAQTTFLARTRDKARQGRDGAGRAVRSSALTKLIDVGCYSEDLPQAVAQADLIFEAVAENFEIKHEMLELIDRHRRPDSIVATVSSGLSITDLAKSRSESFARNFLGLHFFNPPQVIVGTELIAGQATDPALVDFIDAYSTHKLGRLMVRTANTPGFAGNRIGFKVLNEVCQLAEEYGPLVIDKVVGRYTGRALAPLATVDLVGWDVHQAICDNIYDKVKDEAIETYRMPDYMRRLIAAGTLGTKSGKGFFMRNKGEPLRVLDIKSGEYKDARSIEVPKLPFAEQIIFLNSIGAYKRAMEVFTTAEGKWANLARKVIGGYISYALCRVGEVTESVIGVDSIMAAGFNWAPPSALVEAIGVKSTVKILEDNKLTVPPLLERALKNGTERFFDEPRLSLGKYFVAKS